jgi:Leucine-rich repeat (LRR) protein
LVIEDADGTTLPDTIGRLSTLTRLVVYMAELEELPESLTQLSSLRVLDLEKAMQVVFTLYGLTALEHIDIRQREAYFAPYIVNDIGPFDRFPNLQSLRITGIDPHNVQFGAHGMLTSLELYQCHQLLELPASLGNLTQLRELILRSNAQLQRLPDEVSRLTALTAVVIECNDVLNIQFITSLTNLRHATLDNCEPLANVAPLRNLEKLSIRASASHNWPAGFTSLSKLTMFSSYPNLTGDIPALCRLPRLLSLTVHCTQYSIDQFSGMLANATSITSLDVAVPTTSGFCFGMAAVATLRNLKKVSITYLGFDQGDMPKSMTNLSRLTSLSVAIHCCTEIPDVIFSLTTLRHLEIIYNFGPQRLPEQITQLQLLRELGLATSMQLCEQVTRLQFLARIEGGANKGDAEHETARAGIAKREKKKIIC